MTKTEIGEARTNLVRTIIAIKKLKTQKAALTKAHSKNRKGAKP